MPRVSVIIPTYNRKAYVQEAIDSVLTQTYIDYEVIVVDDGSTDETGEALQVCYKDQIRYVWQENHGESVARNRGIDMAQGEYIAFLDSDDMWMPDKLEKQVAYLDAYCELGAVICQGLIIDEQGNTRPDAPVLGAKTSDEDLTLDALLTINTISAPSMLMVRHVIVSSIGGFDPDIRYGEDWDFCIRLRACAPIAHLKESLCCIRRHQETQSHLKRWDKIQSTLADRLAVIAKCFTLVYGNGSDDIELRQKAECLQYTEAALYALVYGHHGLACQWLGCVARGLQNRWIDPLSMAGEYSILLIEMLQQKMQHNAKELPVILSTTFDTLRLAQLSNQFRIVFVGQVLAVLFFDAAQKDNQELVRWIMPRLLFFSPRWAGNLGVWSIGLDALLGTATTSRLRRLLNKTGVRTSTAKIPGSSS